MPLPCPSVLAVAQIGCDSCHVTFRAPSSSSPFLLRLAPPSHRASALPARQGRGYCLFIPLSFLFSVLGPRYIVFYGGLRHRRPTQKTQWGQIVKPGRSLGPTFIFTDNNLAPKSDTFFNIITSFRSVLRLILHIAPCYAVCVFNSFFVCDGARCFQQR